MDTPPREAIQREIRLGLARLAANAGEKSPEGGCSGRRWLSIPPIKSSALSSAEPSPLAWVGVARPLRM